MYHIKKDKRSQKSAQLLYEGLMRCLNKKTFTQITITDLQKESYVGRATFYRLFDTLPDIFSYKCDSIFIEVFNNWQNNQDISVEKTFLLFSQQWMSHKELFCAIVRTQHINIIYEVHQRNAKKIQKMLFHDSNLDQTQLDYLVAMLASVMSSVLIVWSENGCKENEHELLSIVRNAFHLLFESLS